MKKIISTFVVLFVLAAVAVPAASFNVQGYSGIPTFSIVSVITDQKVTIQTYNFPAGYTFNVRMAARGNQAIGGTLVTTTGSGSGGAFQVTYTIPAALQGLQQIAIRLESTTGGFFAYNWFVNNTTSATVTPGPTPTPGFSGIPTIAIQSVVVDTSVTIKTNNFPANRTFNVLMAARGNQAIGGILVTTTASGPGGVFTVTYSIPAALHGLQQIAIRLESTTGGFFAYNWFWNNTTSATPGPTPIPGYTGFPTFSIASVMHDTSVTISGTNFPPSKDFRVLMGPMGTKGIGGTYVATTSTGAGGALSATYSIPAGLMGSTRIAIRMEATTGGWFAYNWFWNTTAP